MKPAKYKIEDDRVILTEEYKFEWGVIPVGTSFDGYSIPSWLYWFHKPLEGNLTPSIIHDWMLIKGHSYAHNAFKIALKKFGFEQPKRQLMYIAVRAYQVIKYPNIFKEGEQ